MWINEDFVQCLQDFTFKEEHETSINPEYSQCPLDMGHGIWFTETK